MSALEILLNINHFKNTTPLMEGRSGVVFAGEQVIKQVAKPIPKPVQRHYKQTDTPENLLLGRIMDKKTMKRGNMKCWSRRWWGVIGKAEQDKCIQGWIDAGIVTVSITKSPKNGAVAQVIQWVGGLK